MESELCPFCMEDGYFILCVYRKHTTLHPTINCNHIFSTYDLLGSLIDVPVITSLCLCSSVAMYTFESLEEHKVTTRCVVSCQHITQNFCLMNESAT